MDSQEIRRSKIYAIVTAGGKQYKVEEGSEIVVNRLSGKEGDKIILREVNLLNSDGMIEIGKPVLGNVEIEATIKEHIKGDKVIAFKYKPKKGSRRKVGHRQLLTVLHLDKIRLLNKNENK